MAGWWKWGKYKREKLERQKRGWEVIEKRIEWRIEESHTLGGTSGIVSHVYVLMDFGTSNVRYVGITDDPIRRFQEHLRSGILGGKFRFAIIADVHAPRFGSDLLYKLLGISEYSYRAFEHKIERTYIARYQANGCNLLNIAGNQKE